MMKFNTAVIAASMVATTAFAQAFQPRDLATELKQNVCHVATPDQLHAMKAQGYEMMGRLHFHNSKLFKAASNEIINTPPAGKLTRNAYMSAVAFRPYMGYPTKLHADGVAVDLVETDDNLYLHNPISTFITRSWLKGEKKKAGIAGNADSVLVKLPVAIAEATVESSTGEDSTAVLYLQNLDYNSDSTAMVPVKDQVVKYTWKGDTLQKVSKYILGLVDVQGNWYGYGDESAVIFKTIDVPTRVPAEATKCNFILQYETEPKAVTKRTVNGAKNGNDYYIGDLDEGQDLYARGMLKDGKVVFGTQYMGVDTARLYHIYYIPAEVEYTYDDNYDVYRLTSENVLPDGLAYTVEANGQLTTDKAFIVNVGKFYLTRNVFNKSEFKMWEDKAYTPQAPLIIKVYPYTEDNMYGAFRFTLAKTDADGNELDVNKLFYQVFIDKDANPNAAPYRFTTDKYTDFKEDMETLPATFTDGYDVSFRGDVYTVMIEDPVFAATNVGVKAIYKGGNDTKESAITWAQVGGQPSGISGIAGDKDAVKSTDYYDLGGRRVLAPAKGICIKAVKYADGSTKFVKEIR